MIKNTDSALKVAEFLLQIKAIKLSPQTPFNWASGWKSPIYCDNRKTLSHPNVRTYIRQQFSEMCEDIYGKPDVIAGVATGGIAIGALVAQELGLPFVYVRSSSKGHGLQNQIEGDLQEGQSVVVIEDLVSTGNSSLKAVEALREAGANVKGMLAIFTYGFDVAAQNFEKANCKLTCLCDYDVMLEKALEEDYITQNQIASLQEWRNSPSTWQQ